MPKPSLKTVKRLFALSRNVCAFPECSSPIIDDNGTVLGEICHISAHNPEGPRYDLNQSDAKRHGFDNLMLLCAAHHKRIDDNVADFPRERLLDMKKAHEDRSSSTPASADDRLLKLLIERMPVATNVSGNNNIVVNAQNISLSGLNYDQARQIAIDVYKANALELRGIAAEIATRRAEEVTSRLLQELARDSIDLSPLSDPDVQHALFAAQKAAARKGTPELTSLLVDLLAERVKSHQHDLLRIVLNEAIETTSRLTPDQLDALSLIFSLRYVEDRTPVDLQTFRQYFDRMVAPFLQGASNTSMRLQHLQYSGCAHLATQPFQISNAFLSRYSHILAVDVSEEVLRKSARLEEESFQKALTALFRRKSPHALEAKPQPKEEVEDAKAVDYHLESLQVGIISASEPHVAHRPFDLEEDAHLRKAVHTNVRDMLNVFRRQALVLSVSLIEEISREFFFEFFRYKPAAMYDFLRDDKLASNGLVPLKDILAAPTKESLLLRLASRAADTALLGGTIKRAPRIRRLTNIPIEADLISRVDTIENVRHRIVHHANEPEVSQKDCESAFGLVHDFLRELGSQAKCASMTYHDPAFLVDEEPPPPSVND